MKTMTCRQLGGACDKKFHANSFEEIAELGKRHGMEMYQKGDDDHIRAMSEMGKLMGTPEAMNEWMERKRREFEAIPDEK